MDQALWLPEDIKTQEGTRTWPLQEMRRQRQPTTPRLATTIQMFLLYAGVQIIQNKPQNYKPPMADSSRLNVTNLVALSVPHSSPEDKIWLWSQSVPPTADSISRFDPIAWHLFLFPLFYSKHNGTCIQICIYTYTNICIRIRTHRCTYTFSYIKYLYLLRCTFAHAYSFIPIESNISGVEPGSGRNCTFGSELISSKTMRCLAGTILQMFIVRGTSARFGVRACHSYSTHHDGKTGLQREGH